MATYDPPQPLWKRNAAGILDFILATAVFGVLLFQVFPNTKTSHLNGTTQTFYGLQPVGTLALVVFLIGYFVVLGRTGGTVFQRLFQMKRANSAP